MMTPLAEALREAAKALERAEDAARHYSSPEREAVQREIVAAAANVGRGLHLIGEVR
jgi:hypothetical protein